MIWLTQWAPAFLVGLLIGLLIGSTAADPRREGHVPHRLVRRLVRRVPWLRSLGLALVLAGVALVLAATAVWLNSRALPLRTFQAYQECKSRYDARFAEVYRARTTAATEGFEALDPALVGIARVITEALDPGTRPGAQEQNFAALLVALDQYQKVRSDQGAAQRRSPPPPQPEDVCGRPPEVD